MFVWVDAIPAVLGNKVVFDRGNIGDSDALASRSRGFGPFTLDEQRFLKVICGALIPIMTPRPM